MLSDPDLFAKLAGLADVSLQTLNYLVQQMEHLTVRELAACDLLQTVAIAIKGLAAAEADRQRRCQESGDDSPAESVPAADPDRHVAAVGR